MKKPVGQDTILPSEEALSYEWFERSRKECGAAAEEFLVSHKSYHLELQPFLFGAKGRNAVQTYHDHGRHQNVYRSIHILVYELRADMRRIMQERKLNDLLGCRGLAEYVLDCRRWTALCSRKRPFPSMSDEKICILITRMGDERKGENIPWIKKMNGLCKIR